MSSGTKRAKREQYFVIAFFIAVFNNIQTLNFKAQLTIGFSLPSIKIMATSHEP